MSNDSKELDRYLKDIQRALGGIKKSERLEIVEEIRSHILEMKSESPDKSLEDVIEQFGTPRKIAKNYLEERGDDSAVSSSSFSTKAILVVVVILLVSLLSIFLFNKNSGNKTTVVQKQERVESESESESASSFGKKCQVGPESGVTCDSVMNCSSKEFVNGCCIMGSCNKGGQRFKIGEKCTIHTGESGVRCDSARNCSKGPEEFTDGCCINGTCLNQ